MDNKFFKKIIAQNSKDLQIISALTSGSKTKVSNVKYLPKNKIFLLLVDRKDKENNDDLINSIIKFDYIDGAKCNKTLNQADPDTILELLAIDIFKKNQNYEIIIYFSKNSFINLTSEIIECSLEDIKKTNDKNT